jgi:hypothetical protein
MKAVKGLLALAALVVLSLGFWVITNGRLAFGTNPELDYYIRTIPPGPRLTELEVVRTAESFWDTEPFNRYLSTKSMGERPVAAWPPTPYLRRGDRWYGKPLFDSATRSWSVHVQGNARSSGVWVQGWVVVSELNQNTRLVVSGKLKEDPRIH